jgi:hypothetical protein
VPLLLLLVRSHMIGEISHALQLLLAVPAGWLADRYRRDAVLRGAAAVGAFAGEGSSAAGRSISAWPAGGCCETPTLPAISS